MAVDYLCSVYVTDNRGTRTHLWATPEILVTDPAPNRKTGDTGAERRVIPLASIQAIEIDTITGADSQLRWKATTGFLGGGTRVQPVTGIHATLDDGEHILWRMAVSPIEARAALGRLLAAV